MTRIQSIASPTKLFSLPRAWRGIAALILSLMFAPVVLADQSAPATPPDAQSMTTLTDQQFQEKISQLPPEIRTELENLRAQSSGSEQAATEANSLGMSHDLSPWGMYQNADVVVKAVMIGLAIASIITWTIWIAKGFELLGAKRRLRTEIANLKKARTLSEAGETAAKEGTLANLLVHDAMEEMRLSTNSREREGIKERVSFRLERLVAACGRNMSSGTGVLATIGSTAPFVGLFGTVWHHEQLHRHRQDPDHQPRRRRSRHR